MNLNSSLICLSVIVLAAGCRQEKPAPVQPAQAVPVQHAPVSPIKAPVPVAMAPSVSAPAVKDAAPMQAPKLAPISSMKVYEFREGKTYISRITLLTDSLLEVHDFLKDGDSGAGWHGDFNKALTVPYEISGMILIIKAATGAQIYEITAEGLMDRADGRRVYKYIENPAEMPKAEMKVDINFPLGDM